MPILKITSKDKAKLEAFKRTYEALGDELSETDELVKHIKKKAGVAILMRMAAVNSVDRNLFQEDTEMADTYNRQNALLDSNGSSKDPLPLLEKDDTMMVAGDYVNTVNNIAKPEQPEVAVQPVISEVTKKMNPLLQNTLMTTLGASILGGGIGLGQLMFGTESDKPDQKPPAVAPIEDKDTIGVLEFDKE